MPVSRWAVTLFSFYVLLLWAPSALFARPRRNAITKIGWAIQNCKKVMDAGIGAAKWKHVSGWTWYRNSALRMDPSIATWNGKARGFRVKVWIPKCNEFFRKVDKRLKQRRTAAASKQRRCPFLKREIKAAGMGPDYDYKTCVAKREHYGRIEKSPTRQSYSRALRSCVLDMPGPCWQPKRHRLGRKVITCGVKEDVLVQPKVGAGWGRIRMGGVINPPKPLKSCRFPRPQRRWKKYLKASRIGNYRRRPGNVIVADPGATWEYRRNAYGRIVSRELAIRIYGKYWFVPRCPGRDIYAVCASSGSRTAEDADRATLRIKMARKLKGNENVGCQLAAWTAIQSIRRARHRRGKLKRQGKWAKGLTYVIDEAGAVDERKLFARLHKQKKEALRLFRACGGPRKPPF